MLNFLFLLYGWHSASACNGFEDDGVMIAAASDEFWNDGGACGQMYEVSCLSGTNDGTPEPCLGSGSVLVMIVDYCPPGSCRATIDLSQEAFQSIADTDAGVINISYQQSVISSWKVITFINIKLFSLGFKCLIFFLYVLHFKYFPFNLCIFYLLFLGYMQGLKAGV